VVSVRKGAVVVKGALDGDINGVDLLPLEREGGHFVLDDGDHHIRRRAIERTVLGGSTHKNTITNLTILCIHGSQCYKTIGGIGVNMVTTHELADFFRRFWVGIDIGG
jgi:hypothetical protein